MSSRPENGKKRVHRSSSMIGSPWRRDMLRTQRELKLDGASPFDSPGLRHSTPLSLASSLQLPRPTSPLSDQTSPTTASKLGSSRVLVSPKRTPKKRVANKSLQQQHGSNLPTSSVPSKNQQGVRSIALAFETDERATQLFLAHTPIETPWAVQVTGEAFLARRMEGKAEPYDVRGGIFANEPRLGKTRTVMLRIFHAIQQHVASGKRRFGTPFLIVCPTDVVRVWFTETRALLGPNILSLERVDTDASKALLSQQDVSRLVDKLRNQTDVIVTTYPTLSRTQSGIADVLRSLVYAGIFCDEAHLLQNETTAEFNSIHALCAYSKWYITGTPIQNDISSLRSALRICGVKDSVMNKFHSGEDIALFARQLTLRYVARIGGHIELGPSVENEDESNWVPRLRPIPIEHISLNNIELLVYRYLVHQRLGLNFMETIAVTEGPDEEPDFEDIGVDDDNMEISNSSSAASSSHKRSRGLSFATIGFLERYCISPMTMLNAFERGALVLPTDVILPPSRFLLVVPPYISDAEIAAAAKKKEQEEKEKKEQGDFMEGVETTEPREETSPESEYYDNILQAAIRESTYEAIGFDEHRVREQTPVEWREHVDMVLKRLLPPVSTKERWICRTLLTHLLDNTGEKVIIFSQWTKPLVHLARLLTLRLTLGVPNARQFVFLHGKVPTSKREEERDRFMNDPACGVMLSTLKTNTLGVDLTVANIAVLCDPAWNPTHEFQATSRVLGPRQLKPVTLYRLVAQHTIDNLVAARADRKVKLDAMLPMSLQDENREIQQILEETSKHALLDAMLTT